MVVDETQSAVTVTQRAKTHTSEIMVDMSRVPAANDDMPADVRAVCDRLKERYGSLPLNHAVLARRPSVFRAFRGMWDGLEASGLLPARLVDLVNVRVAALIGCGL
jgi:hypothetical protein